MPTNPFDLDSLDLQISPIQGAGDMVDPQKTPTTITIIILTLDACGYSARSYVCCRLISAIARNC
jgi:hypothetical protein